MDVFAPGVDVLGAWPTSDLASNVISDTTAAAGFAAGVAAKFIAENGTANPNDVAEAIRVASVSNDCSVGHRVLNLTAVPACVADLTGDGKVGFPDLTMLLAAWGDCPQQ